jgi:hypothetical protein
MGILNESGYTNKKIPIFTGEKWSEPSVKIYTRGSNVKDSLPKTTLQK